MANVLRCPLLDDLASMGLIKLKEIEAHIATGNCWRFHPPLTELILKGSLEGTTPLLVACHHGQLDSVKHITESWKVDVNNAATYFPDAVTKIDRATPLFVASTNGHLGIVRYLVGNGVEILSTASTTNQRYDGLTPLHGAVCYFNRQEEYKKRRYKKDKERAATVRYLLESGVDPSILPSDGSPVWMMPLCGADVIKELLNYDKMSLSQRSPLNGGTVLHHWVRLPGKCNEFSSLTVVKLLLENGDAKLLRVQDDSGFTPLLEAVNILEIFALNGSKQSTKFSVLNLLLERDDILPIEKNRDHGIGRS